MTPERLKEIDSDLISHEESSAVVLRELIEEVRRLRDREKKWESKLKAARERAGAAESRANVSEHTIQIWDRTHEHLDPAKMAARALAMRTALFMIAEAGNSGMTIDEAITEALGALE